MLIYERIWAVIFGNLFLVATTMVVSAPWLSMLLLLLLMRSSVYTTTVGGRTPFSYFKLFLGWKACESMTRASSYSSGSPRAGLPFILILGTCVETLKFISCLQRPLLRLLKHFLFSAWLFPFIGLTPPNSDHFWWILRFIVVTNIITFTVWSLIMSKRLSSNEYLYIHHCHRYHHLCSWYC